MMHDELAKLLIQRLGYEPLTRGKVPPKVYLDSNGQLWDAPINEGGEMFIYVGNVTRYGEETGYVLWLRLWDNTEEGLEVDHRDGKDPSFRWSTNTSTKNLALMGKLLGHLQTTSDENLIQTPPPAPAPEIPQEKTFWQKLFE